MGNSMNARYSRLQWRLLTTASAVALLMPVCGYRVAQAADKAEDHPLLWLEMGWQYERYNGQGDPFAPLFVLTQPRPKVETFSPLGIQTLPIYSYGADAKIIFQPEDSDWLLSASLRYGRANGRRHVHNQTQLPTDPKLYVGTFYVSRAHGRDVAVAADALQNTAEAHAILDFQAGKDVGLGVFGHDGTSTLAFGVRFAQLHSRSTTGLDEFPDMSKQAYKIDLKYHNTWHRYKAEGDSRRSFSGLGPTISWNASAPLAGAIEDGELGLDWGVTAGLLFGRQKTKIQHHTTVVHYSNYLLKYHNSTAHNAANPVRSRSVTVPDLGGSAALSYRIENFKVTAGYRADFFFGAIDSGWDTPHSATRGFYGPFASVSVGVGD